MTCCTVIDFNTRRVLNQDELDISFVEKARQLAIDIRYTADALVDAMDEGEYMHCDMLSNFLFNQCEEYKEHTTKGDAL